MEYHKISISQCGPDGVWPDFSPGINVLRPCMNGSPFQTGMYERILSYMHVFILYLLYANIHSTLRSNANSIGPGGGLWRLGSFPSRVPSWLCSVTVWSLNRSWSHPGTQEVQTVHIMHRIKCVQINGHPEAMYSPLGVLVWSVVWSYCHYL